MKTYQDLQAVGNAESERMRFCESAIADFAASAQYRTAHNADLYYRHQNPTIEAAQKIVYDLLGRAKADIYSANHKIPSAYYGYFVTQEVQFLLGNGVSFVNSGTKKKLGKDIDNAIQRLTTAAINGGVAFGFWNYDHLEVFPLAEDGSPSFVPLYDEENGGLAAGIRYWQIAANKPLRYTLYERDGYTDYIKRNGVSEVYANKRPYVLTIQKSDTGTAILNGANYPGLPIIPLYNINRQSEIIGNQATIDAYDLMASALVNNVDDGNLIYWVLKNCGGMSEEDDAKFLENLRRLKVAHADGDDGAGVEAHTVNAPFEANEAALERLRTQLFDDFMALDTRNIASGTATATQIRAAYEPLNAKADKLEFQVTAFIKALLELLKIADAPTYTRSYNSNRKEDIEALVAAGEYLPRPYVTRKILEILGDIDAVDDVEAQMAAGEASTVILDGDKDGAVD